MRASASVILTAVLVASIAQCDGSYPDEPCEPDKCGIWGVSAGRYCSNGFHAYCSMGYYCLGRMGCPVACSVGTYAANYRQTACDLCPTGKYQQLTAKSFCNDCGVNYYTSSSGATSSSLCLNCPSPNVVDAARSACVTMESTWNPDMCPVEDVPPGQFCSTFTSPAGARACPAGFSCPGGDISPIPCAAGTYQQSTGTSFCRQCLAGSSQPLTKQTTCTSCTPWTYQPNPGQPSCLGCDSGTFTSSNGALGCLDCPPGSVQPSQGQSSCQSCSSGTYQSSSGETQCLACGNVNVPRFSLNQPTSCIYLTLC